MKAEASTMALLQALEYAQDHGDKDSVDTGLRMIWKRLEPMMKANLHAFPPNCVLALSYYFHHDGNFGEAVEELLDKYTPTEQDAKEIEEALIVFRTGIDLIINMKKETAA